MFNMENWYPQRSLEYPQILRLNLYFFYYLGHHMVVVITLVL